jgi:hypothetical protein
VEEPLLPRVGLGERDRLGGTAGELQIPQGLVVDGEDRAGRPVLGRHVADGRAVRERHVGHAGTVELDELPDDAAVAEHLGDGQNEVGGGRALGKGARQLEADDPRDQHRQRLAEHRRLRLDAADPPAEHPEAVDHRRVRVGPDERVRIGAQRPRPAVVGEDDLGEVLEVDLVDDAGVRRDHPQAVERLLAPAQERVALGVAGELDVGVAPEGVGHAGDLGDDRVVDDEIRRQQRVDLAGVATDVGHRVAHRRDVHDRRHTREVLEQHAGGRPEDLAARLGVRVPPRERLDVLGADGVAVLVAQKVLEQDPQRVRQPADVETVGERVEPEDLVGALPHLQRRPGVEGVGHGVLLCDAAAAPPR